MTERRSERWLVTSEAATRGVRTRTGADDAAIEIRIGSGDAARTLHAAIISCSEDTCVVSVEGQPTVVRLAPEEGSYHAMVGGESFDVTPAAGQTGDSRSNDAPGARETSPTADTDALSAPMPATVSAILVEPDAVVEAGDTLLRLEAMKMELAIHAPSTGRVTTVNCRVGDLVLPGRPLVTLER